MGTSIVKHAVLSFLMSYMVLFISLVLNTFWHARGGMIGRIGVISMTKRLPLIWQFWVLAAAFFVGLLVLGNWRR